LLLLLHHHLPLDFFFDFSYLLHDEYFLLQF
ncbi:MAG: hypothetical protein RL622_499, partial [Actinomycetota bacterium]